MKPKHEYRPINEWKEEDRPREKLMLKGKHVLSNAELIAILFGTGTREKSAIDLAKELLFTVNDNLNELAKKNVKDLQKLKGIGEAKAIGLITALELGKRRNLEAILEKPFISSSQVAYQLFKEYLEDLSHEEFWAMYLNQSNKMLEIHQLSVGGITGTVIDLRRLFKKAIELNATGIIVAHNHPSGAIRPSQQDRSLTQRIKQAGDLLEVKLFDHLIIGEKKYYSFADESEIR